MSPSAPESRELITTSILRTADGWWVQTAYVAARIATSAATTGQLLAHRTAIDAAAHNTRTVPIDSLRLISPVTAPCRVVAQMTNFASHVKSAGMDPKTVPLTFFRKTSGSINGPFDKIIKPPHVKLLDYEVEIGLVIGRDIAPPKPPEVKAFLKREASNPKYLQHGDILEVSIATNDSAIDLGTQRTAVSYA